MNQFGRELEEVGTAANRMKFGNTHAQISNAEAHVTVHVVPKPLLHAAPAGGEIPLPLPHDDAGRTRLQFLIVSKG